MGSKKDIKISIDIIPPYSGYGGFDEWSIYDLSNDQIDNFLEALDKLVLKHKGEYTGIE